jgi:hypothetical protein
MTGGRFAIPFLFSFLFLLIDSTMRIPKPKVSPCGRSREANSELSSQTSFGQGTLTNSDSFYLV